jgi:hypothetical protein
MGFKIEVGGRTYEALNFSVQEASTPLAAGDSSGSVGTIRVDIPFPDPDLLPNHPINKYGSHILVGKPIRLADTRKGFTLGKITQVQNSRATGLIQLTALSRLGELNVYNVQAQPFVGTLSNAFQYYMSLANITYDFAVDPTIATKPVIFPGWNGELWYHLKQLAAAVDCDVSLVSGIILLRPIRVRTATRGRDLDRPVSVGGGSLAQNIEVIHYNNRQITNELVYPPGGWSETVTTINVNSGETIEEVLELSASVSSIQQPVMQTFVSQLHDSSSVFTVVGDDGLPIDPNAWTNQGGSLRVEINPDTTSLTVHITAPTGLPNKDGEEIGVYGISLSSESGTGRYSTLRILGSGVAYNKQTIRIPTGVTPSETATEVGVTIDNPFLGTLDDVYRAGLRAVRGYNGSAMTVNGSVIAINQLGDSGELVLTTYGEVQTVYAGKTYAQVQTLNAGKSYLQVQADFNTGADSLFENQVFGNVNGARVWDKQSARWYRIRNGTLMPGQMQFDAEDDLTHADVATFRSGLTYATLQTQFTGMTYREVDLMGLR